MASERAAGGGPGAASSVERECTSVTSLFALRTGASLSRNAGASACEEGWRTCQVNEACGLSHLAAPSRQVCVVLTGPLVQTQAQSN